MRELSIGAGRLPSMKIHVALLLLCSLTWVSAAELPIREVILYKHGVGYFERSGSIAAGEVARLDFKASEMNDVLKSLMISGKDERVSGLRYDSSIPLEEKLSDFPFKLDASQPLSGVLDQLKGARVEMQVGSEKVSGAIVAARAVAGDKERAERQQIVLLLDSGEMRTFDLDAASSIKFTDAQLAAQFRSYLGALTAARSREKRSVYIDGNSTGGRDITATYIIPTPIWKSSYRLLFAQTGEPTLEGWAIVDNTTGEDWTNVQMALVSGKPISFISELYSPRYIQRMMAELPEEKAQKPVLYQGALAGLPPATAGVVGGMINGQSQSDRVQNFAMMQAAPQVKFRAASQSALSQSASTTELADLFEYRIAQPVTIKKNESAMLPFLQDRIKARKVVIYSDESSSHPLNAAELINSTAKTLDGGPITVYDGGGYVGEALVETVKANDKRLISYGVDLGTRITNKIDSEEREEREIHLVRGVLNIRAATVRKTSYSIDNVDAKPKTLIIEHPLDEEFQVMNQKPSETTETARRFEMKLAPSATVTFPVIEEKVETETEALANMSPDVLVQFATNKHLSDAGRRDIGQIVELKRQMAANGSDANATKARIENTAQDEERVRKNLVSFNNVSGQQELVQKYAAELARLEREVGTLRDHQTDLAAKNAELQAALDERMEKMTF